MGIALNVAPAGFAMERDLPAGFAAFYLALHRRFTRAQQALARARTERLARAHAGDLPKDPPPPEATRAAWRVELPAWCAGRRNQMTGPADDAELCVKLLNSGAPGVVLDLEDSMANTWGHLMLGHRNIAAALYGELTYDDATRGRTVTVDPSDTVIFTRVRGLHLSQAGVIAHVPTSASLFDLALIVFRLEYERLRHPLCIYVPKSESAQEARWWKEVFDALIDAKGWERGAIKAMALIESHPIAYEMEEFLYELREYVLGLHFGRWDYLASSIHYNFHDRQWLLPDRNTIPDDAPFFGRVRAILLEIAHKHGALAAGVMTAQPDLRPAPRAAGATTLAGTRAAVRTVIRYRHGVLEGRGASLLDGCMEDLATDRICRLMIAQRLRHPGEYAPSSLAALFDEELERILTELPAAANGRTRGRYRKAREISEAMIRGGAFDPT